MSRFENPNENSAPASLKNLAAASFLYHTIDNFDEEEFLNLCATLQAPEAPEAPEAPDSSEKKYQKLSKLLKLEALTVNQQMRQFIINDILIKKILPHIRYSDKVNKFFFYCLLNQPQILSNYRKQFESNEAFNKVLTANLYAAFKASMDSQSHASVKWLLKDASLTPKNKEDINRRGLKNPSSPIFQACVSGHLDMAKWLFENTELKPYEKIISWEESLVVLYTNNVFIQTCSKGYTDVAKWLWSNTNFSDDNKSKLLTYTGCYLFHLICERGYLDLAKWLWSEAGLTPTMKKAMITDQDYYLFYSICEYGRIDIAKWLWSEAGLTDEEKKALPCANGYNLFYTSCDHGHPEMIKWLFDVADLSAEQKLTIVNLDGYYLFHSACQEGHLDIAKFLFSLATDKLKADMIKAKFHVDFKNYSHGYGEYMSFTYACKTKKYNIARWLVNEAASTLDEKIAMLKANNYRGFTYVCENGSLEMAQWLWNNSGLTDNQKIDMISANNHDTFLAACLSGNLDLVKWFVIEARKIDIELTTILKPDQLEKIFLPLLYTTQEKMKISPLNKQACDQLLKKSFSIISYLLEPKHFKDKISLLNNVMNSKNWMPMKKSKQNFMNKFEKLLNVYRMEEANNTNYNGYCTIFTSGGTQERFYRHHGGFNDDMGIRRVKT